MAGSTEGIFASRSFRLYYAGQALSYLGDGLRMLAIPLLVFHLTGSGLSTGLTYALELLPFALFSTVGGSLADRLDRRRLMIVCDALRFAIMVTFTIAYVGHWLSLPLIYGGIVLLGICAATFLGGQASSIPFLLGKDRSKGAVASLIGVEQGVNLVAPPIGGALFATSGPVTLLAINALTYVVSQVTLSRVAGFGPAAPGAMPSLREIVSDIGAGFAFTMRDRTMRVMVWIQFFVNGCAFIGVAGLIPYLKLELHSSDRAVGIAFGAFALGAIAGSVLASGTHFRFGPAFVAATLLDGAAWLPIVWLHQYVLAVPAIAASSLFGTYAATMIVSWRMRVVPEDLVGRVFGANRLVILVGTFPGAIAGGYLCDHAGPRSAALASGCGMLLGALALSAFPSIRAEDR